MAGNKYVALIAGRLQEVFGIQSSAGAGDAGKIPALDAAGKIDQSMMPTGVGPDTTSLVASESISAGALVNVFDSGGGTMKVRNADATTSGKEADGFILSAVTTGQTALVYHEGTITGLSSLTGGSRYYLSATPGAVTATAPSTSGNVVQYVGRATSTTTISYEATDGVILA